MHRIFILFLTATLIGSQSFYSLAEQTLKSVNATITVTHTSAEEWLVEYEFGQPVETMVLGPSVLDYRQSSWKILSPNVALINADDGEKIVTQGEPFSSLAINVSHYSDYPMNNYAPSAKFSDSGAALFTEFFFGDVISNGSSHTLSTAFKFRTKLNENIITHPQISNGRGVYTYFGPQKMKRSGDVDLIVDPKMPTWLQESFNKVVPIVSKVYSQRLKHHLKTAPQVMLSSGDIESMNSFSVKGGAKNNQLVMIYKGKELLQPSKEKQHMLERLIAHEMAHLWQQDVKNGGMSSKEPWIHEGGAEILAVAALVKANVWEKDYLEKYSGYYTKRCADILGEQTLKEKIEQGNWDAVYACGFSHFAQMDADIFDVWANLISNADRTGEHFSTEMLNSFSASEKKPK